MTLSGFERVLGIVRVLSRAENGDRQLSENGERAFELSQSSHAEMEHGPRRDGHG